MTGPGAGSEHGADGGAPSDPGGEPVEELLDRLRQVVEQARAMPMSASCVVHRGEVLEMLDGVRSALPAQLDRASEILAQADGVLAEARRQGALEVTRARAAAEELLSEQAVVAAATAHVERLVADAEAQAARLRREADDYCDRRLADFEIDLDRIGQQVRRGREKLAARVAAPEELHDPAAAPGQAVPDDVVT